MVLNLGIISGDLIPIRIQIEPEAPENSLLQRHKVSIILKANWNKDANELVSPQRPVLPKHSVNIDSLWTLAKLDFS